MANSVVSPLPFDGERLERYLSALNDAIAALEAEANDESAKIRYRTAATETAHDLCELRDLIPALLDARKDAERYRWLRDNPLGLRAIRGTVWPMHFTDDQVDAAIESASTEKTEFVVDGHVRRESDRCDMRGPDLRRACNAPGAYWYPSYGGGVAVLCEAHGAKHFPIGAQRIADRTWHGGGEPLTTEPSDVHP